MLLQQEGGRHCASACDNRCQRELTRCVIRRPRLQILRSFPGPPPVQRTALRLLTDHLFLPRERLEGRPPASLHALQCRPRVRRQERRWPRILTKEGPCSKRIL